MRKFFLIVMIGGFASCSSPKMAYYFDHYEYKTARKESPKLTETQPLVSQDVLIAPAPEKLIASADKTIVPELAKRNESSTSMTREEAIEQIKNMSRVERKEFRKEVKKEIKAMKKNPSPKSTQALEHDVRYAAIFGSVGVVLLIIGGDVLSVLGAVALLIGLYFFIRWLSNQ